MIDPSVSSGCGLKQRTRPWPWWQRTTAPRRAVRPLPHRQFPARQAWRPARRGIPRRRLPGDDGGGQVALSLDGSISGGRGAAAAAAVRRWTRGGDRLAVVRATEDEVAAHRRRMADIDKASGGKSVWRDLNNPREGEKLYICVAHLISFIEI